MSCELTTYTTNVTDCCYLQILCNGTVVREFNLAELRVVDKGDSFTIRDRVGSMDFSNATIDVTAEDVRVLRCSCAGGAISSCMILSIEEPPTGNLITFSGNLGFVTGQDGVDYIINNAGLSIYLQYECLVYILKDSNDGGVWVYQVQNNLPVFVTSFI